MKISRIKDAKRFYVIYFSGFSLHQEEALFDAYIPQDDTCVVGFSYGAQKAFEYAYNTTQRVDKLILISPAFFQNKKPSFIRTQLHHFQTNQKKYIEQFIQNTCYPSTIDLTPYLKVGTKEELESLLTYTWEKKKIETLIDRGINIEVFFGSKDKIVDSQEAHQYFSKTTCYTYKAYGHLLKGAV